MFWSRLQQIRALELQQVDESECYYLYRSIRISKTELGQLDDEWFNTLMDQLRTEKRNHELEICQQRAKMLDDIGVFEEDNIYWIDYDTRIPYQELHQIAQTRFDLLLIIAKEVISEWQARRERESKTGEPKR